MINKENISYLTVGQTNDLIDHGLTLPKDPWLLVRKSILIYGEKEWFHIKKSELENLGDRTKIKACIKSCSPVFSSLDILEKILLFQSKFPRSNLMLMTTKDLYFQCTFEDPRVFDNNESNLISLKERDFNTLLYKLIIELTKYNIS